jgi:hypothetical protein
MGRTASFVGDVSGAGDGGAVDVVGGSARDVVVVAAERRITIATRS